jgi:hypothetical protein
MQPTKYVGHGQGLGDLRDATGCSMQAGIQQIVDVLHRRRVRTLAKTRPSDVRPAGVYLGVLTFITSVQPDEDDEGLLCKDSQPEPKPGNTGMGQP